MKEDITLKRLILVRSFNVSIGSGHFLDGLRHINLSRIRDEHLVGGRGSVKLLDLPHDVHAGSDLAEDHVAAVQPAGLDSADEELATVGVWTGTAFRFGDGERVRVGDGGSDRWVVVQKLV